MNVAINNARCSIRPLPARTSSAIKNCFKLSCNLRHGKALGPGWDVVRAQMPEAEIGDLIIEVRSATAGVGSFTNRFDHMADLTGRTADQIVAARRAAE